MIKMLQSLKEAHPQTKFFILMVVIYIGALVWTTAQSYARLQYSRSDKAHGPIIISQEQYPNEY